MKTSKLLMTTGPILAALGSKETSPVENDQSYRYGNLGRRVPVVGPGEAFAPADPLSIGDGVDPISALASSRIAPAWFPYGGGEVRQGTDYVNAGSFKQFMAAVEGLSLQGDGRRFLGTNAAAVADTVSSDFNFDQTPLSIGFLIRFSTSGTNYNPLAGAPISIQTANWVTPWAQSAVAQSSKASPNRSIVFSLDADGLGRPIFVPWATQTFQKVRTVLALPGVVEQAAGVDPSIEVTFPTGLAAISPFQVELVTADHADLDRIVESMASMLLRGR